MSVRITCIRKANGDHENPHVAITSMDWINETNKQTGTSTRIEMYDWIKEKSGVAYVRDNAGHQINVGTAETQRGTKYVRTYSDGIWTDNLLALKEC